MAASIDDPNSWSNTRLLRRTDAGGQCPDMIAAQAFCSRFTDTGIGVRSSWANSDTRSSSSSQRNSSSRASS